MSKDRSTDVPDSRKPTASQTAPARGDERGRGPPADYPGPALLVRADGSVIAANVKGAGLESLLRRGTAPQIIALIDEATARSEVVAGTVSLSVAKGDVVMDITVVPREGDGNLLLLARHEDPKVRLALAARNDVKPEILYFLAEDPSRPVRQAAAANTTTPGTANRKLAGVAEAVAATDDSKPSPTCWPTPAPRSARKHWTA